MRETMDQAQEALVMCRDKGLPVPFEAGDRWRWEELPKLKKIPQNYVVQRQFDMLLSNLKHRKLGRYYALDETGKLVLEMSRTGIVTIPPRNPQQKITLNMEEE